MKVTVDEFRKLKHKSLTLLGMSGVGKTELSKKLPRNKWFHYSGDYRIGTRYLNEAMLDNVKRIAMQNPQLREMLRKDSIYIRNNVTFDHLDPLSGFLGKLGNRELGGLDYEQFIARQQQFRQAEVQAMQDVPVFMNKAREIYGYDCFLNDAGGSICSLGKEECWQTLEQHTVILYLKAGESLTRTLIERAQKYPKPLCYEVDFLKQKIHTYLQQKNLTQVEQIDPNEFVAWVFPHLIDTRVPQYEALAAEYGYTIDANEIFSLRDEDDLMTLICDSISGGR